MLGGLEVGRFGLDLMRLHCLKYNTVGFTCIVNWPGLLASLGGNVQMFKTC